MSKAKFDKGARVEITGGQTGVGVSGEIFWKGERKYGDGERLGIRGDDGETYWIDDVDVEAASGDAPESKHTFDKGDRVRFKDRGRQGTGTIFWIGENRHGPGQRLGVRDDEGDEENDAVWIDGRMAEPLDDDGAAMPQRGGGQSGGGQSGGGQRGGGQRGGGQRGGQRDGGQRGGGESNYRSNDDDSGGDAWSPSLSMDDGPPAAPIDDSMADTWANQDDDGAW